MSYVWDNELHLFRRPQTEAFSYSDGIEVENRLLRIVSEARDRSTFSLELARGITDWPSEYHLSRQRHCLLRPLDIGAGDRVLEIGCGCGAITRFLGEAGAHVVAVEGSPLRATIAAERCRGLDNVRVIVDDLLRFETDEAFDYVLLLGVLEYAALFSGQANPLAHYLASVVRRLAPGGRVVVAIENKVGLKYFNGCEEDHLGVPYFGIQDLYGDRTPRTFGRRELIDQLSAAGLPNTSFYYPFPDYKLPSVILSEAACKDPDFDPVDLLARSHARDYSGSIFRNFDDALAFSSLHKNGLIPDLSNSFLVVATQEASVERSDKDLAVAFSVNRTPELCIQTRLRRKHSTIVVTKEHLLPVAPAQSIAVGNMTITSHLIEAEYHPGRQILWRLLKARALAGSTRDISEALYPWMQFLVQHAHIPVVHNTDVVREPLKLASYRIPGQFMDCTPFNLLESKEQLVAIDVEWETEGDVSLGWVVTRGVVWSLTVGVPSNNQVQSVNEVIEDLSERFGLAVDTTEITNWLALESAFQSAVLGHPTKSLTSLGTSNGTQTIATEITRLRGRISQQDGEIAALQIDRDRQVAELTANLADLLEERERLEGNLAAANVKLTEADLLRSRQATDIKNLTQQLQNDVTVHERLTRDLAAANSELDSANLELKAAIAEAASRSSQLNEVVNSKAWRFTSRLRKIAALDPRRYGSRRQFQKDLELLAASPLFDADWYIANNSDIALSGVDPRAHYLQHGAAEGRDPSPDFSTSRYLATYADVRDAHMNPLVHYLRHGKEEGRQLALAEGSRLPTVEVAEAHNVFDYMSLPFDPSALPKKIAIGVSSLGNFFMAEIAYMMEDAFLKLGVTTRRFSEDEASDVADYEAILIVAPHEFFLLGQGPTALQLLRHSRCMVMFNVEQRQTQWFRVAEQYLPTAIAILDINYHTARHLSKSGYNAFFFPLGYSHYIERSFDGHNLPDHEIFRHMPASVRNTMPTSYAERPIDILFIGASSRRRQEFFARHAAYFAAKSSFIYLPDTSRPFLTTEARTIDFAAFVALVRRSKILLNVHQDEDPFLEWQRIVNLGIMQNTLVVTDHCEPGPCIEPNIHYLDGDLATLPGLCEFALQNPHEAERIIDRARNKIVTQYPMEQVLTKCWAALTKISD